MACPLRLIWWLHKAVVHASSAKHSCHVDVMVLVSCCSSLLFNRSNSASRGTALVGPAPSKPVAFRENGLAFEADLVAGQKTGFFLDQRDNRSWMQVDA
jgi:23S rRNA G2069 N7-methylase RlmK/C1962 C5-methylase RlmI